MRIGGTGPVFRRSAIPDSEAKKNLYKGSVVTVNTSYRPSSKVVGCGGGVCIFLYTGSVVRVSARSSFIADLRNTGPVPPIRTHFNVLFLH